jgi:hypothetical protein
VRGIRDYLGFSHSQNGNYQTANFLLADGQSALFAA